MYKVQTFSFIEIYNERRGLPGGTCKELACQCRRHERHKFDPWVRKIPWRRANHSSILAWRIPWTEKSARLQVPKSWTQLKQLSTAQYIMKETFDFKQL